MFRQRRVAVVLIKHSHFFFFSLSIDRQQLFVETYAVKEVLFRYWISYMNLHTKGLLGYFKSKQSYTFLKFYIQSSSKEIKLNY